MDNESTVVIFRYWKGEVIALFPYIPATRGHCLSYQHIGQHSGADYSGIVATSRPATPKEYTALKTELQSIGYNLTILQR